MSPSRPGRPEATPLKLTLAFITQVTQTELCNLHHSADQQLWPTSALQIFR